MDQNSASWNHVSPGCAKWPAFARSRSFLAPRCAHWAGSSLAALGVIVNFTVHIERSCRGFCPEHRRRVSANGRSAQTPVGAHDITE